MWFWITRRFRLWLLLAVGAPIAAKLLGKAGEEVERRSGGQTNVSQALRKAGEWTGSQSRGPAGRRRRRGRRGRRR